MKELEIPKIITDQFIIDYFSILRKPLWSKLFLSKNENRKRILNYLLNRFKDTIESTSIVEIVYRIINHLEEVPKCIMCGNQCSFSNGIYSNYCSIQCSSSKEARQLLYKSRCKSLLKNYGVTNVFLLDSVKEKIKLTNLEHYGVENPNLNKDIKLKAINTFNEKSEDEKRKIYLKMKETTLKHFGLNNYANREKAKKTCLERYGVENVFLSDIIKEKIKLTNLERYGVENVFLSDIIKEKIKLTNLERYGQESCMHIEEIKNKVKLTYIERYEGYWLGSDMIREKIKQTCIEKYGGDLNHAEYIVNKRLQTCMKHYNNKTFFGSNTFHQMSLKKYGVENFASAEEIKLKRYNTLEKRGYVNGFKSKIEIDIEKWLIKLLGEENVKYNYIDKNRYPWRVDFYLKPYDIFIEIQGYWTHGKHPFNKNDENDIKLLYEIQIKEHNNLLKYGNTLFTDFIQNWTINDVKKRKVAYKNNLKYLEIFSNDFEICKNAILEFINKNTDN